MLVDVLHFAYIYFFPPFTCKYRAHLHLLMSLVFDFTYHFELNLQLFPLDDLSLDAAGNLLLKKSIYIYIYIYCI